MSSLLVAVSSAHNATNITCIAAIFTTNVLMVNESEPAILLVQGIIIIYKQFCRYNYHFRSVGASQ